MLAPSTAPDFEPPREEVDGSPGSEDPRAEQAGIVSAGITPPLRDLSRFVSDGLMVTRQRRILSEYRATRGAPLCVWNRLLDGIGCS